MAMSTARKTLDFDKEFAKVCGAVGAALGTQAYDAPPRSHDVAPAGGAPDSALGATTESASGSND